MKAKQEVKNYQFPPEVELKLFQVFHRLKRKFGCTYMSYFCELSDRKKRLNFTTSPEWQKLYVEEELIKDCPLMTFGWKFATIIVDWESIKPTNKAQRNVSGLRSEFGHANGVSFSSEMFGIRESLGLATEPSQKDFFNHVFNDLAFMRKRILDIREASIDSIKLLGLMDKFSMKKQIIMPLEL